MNIKKRRPTISRAGLPQPLYPNGEVRAQSAYFLGYKFARKNSFVEVVVRTGKLSNMSCASCETRCKYTY